MFLYFCNIGIIYVKKCSADITAVPTVYYAIKSVVLLRIPDFGFDSRVVCKYYKLSFF